MQGSRARALPAVRTAGVGAAEAENLSEAELEQRVFGPAQPVAAPFVRSTAAGKIA